ncbi:hypothetical protein Ae201684P_012444 [Aphanomyces euteiches]|uniref:RING-type domain-containing protein n=1 Tax=Aphanomyces euteiches TaxID=100861 RepID=A0A6G0WZ57_9STRA|nr:hypothetical protein Ae201684_010202 [Aphanomyces euteiches]KAH9075954.1 hypothetical protein Ae201684P_012444 [Aphanomyces euteiches]
MALSVAEQIQHKIAALLNDAPIKRPAVPAVHRSARSIIESLHLRHKQRHIRQMKRVIAHIKEQGRVAEPSPMSHHECVICFEAMVPNSANLRRLPCGHTYHTHCIEAWAARQCTCPYDRTPFYR